MILFKQLVMLERMHALINQSCTGTPKAFSQTIGVSERHLHKLIDELKDMDAPIRYSRKKGTYFYTVPYEIKVSCTMRRLTGEEQGSIIAGGEVNCGYPRVSIDPWAVSCVGRYPALHAVCCKMNYALN